MRQARINNMYLPASGSFVDVRGLQRINRLARVRQRAANFGMADLGSLSGSATRALLAQANAAQQAQAQAAAGRVQLGSMALLKYDPNWAYDPAGDLNLIYWVGTGDSSASPEGYVRDDKYVSQGKYNVYRWKGFGISIASREVQQAQAAAQAQADAVTQAANQAAAAASAASSAQAAAQAIVDAAVGNAQIIAKQGNYDMAINSLNDPKVIKAAAAAGSTSQLQAALSNIVDAQTKAQTTGNTQADAQGALDDAVTGAKTLARKGRFDDADAMLQQATTYARAVGGFSAKSEINSAQIFVDGLRQQADDQAKQAANAQAAATQAQQDAAAQAQAAQALQVQQQQAASAAAQAQAGAATQQQQAQLQFQAMQLQAQMQMQQMQLQAKMAMQPSPPQMSPQGGFSVGQQYQSTDPGGYGSQTDSGGVDSGQPMGPPPVSYGGYADPGQAMQTSMGPAGMITDSDVSGSTGVVDDGSGGGDVMAGLSDTANSDENKATARALSRMRQASSFGLGHIVVGGLAAFVAYKLYQKYRRGR